LLFIINRLGGDLRIGASTLGTLGGLAYDDSEGGVSFSITGSCQLRTTGFCFFPRQCFENIYIPAGRSGWIRLYSNSNIAIFGAFINANANSRTTAGAYSQGRNFHTLTLTSAASITIPILPPSC